MTMSAADIDQIKHTIIAALRTYQQEGYGDPDQRPRDIHDLATNGGDQISMDDEGLDELCQMLNFGDLEIKEVVKDFLPEPALGSPLEEAVAAIRTEYFEILEREYTPGSLDEIVGFEFQLDGLPEGLTTRGSRYAAWCVNLQGILHMDWGLGFYEVVDFTQNHGVYIEQNDLNFVSEVFEFLNDEFGTLTPEITEHTPETTLHRLLTEQFAISVYYKLPEAQRDPVQREAFVEMLAPRVSKIVDDLIRWIEGKSTS